MATYVLGLCLGVGPHTTLIPQEGFLFSSLLPLTRSLTHSHSLSLTLTHPPTHSLRHTHQKESNPYRINEYIRTASAFMTTCLHGNTFGSRKTSRRTSSYMVSMHSDKIAVYMSIVHMNIVFACSALCYFMLIVADESCF